MVGALASVSTSSLIGVAMSCTGNILISLALTVQKLAHRRQFEELSREGSEDEDGDRDERPGNGHRRKRRGSSTDSDDNEEPSPLGTRSRYDTMPVVLVQSPSKDTADTKTPDNQPGLRGKGQMGVILVNPPTPTSSSTSTPSRSRSEQTLHDGNGHGQHQQHEDGQEGKGKQVKEGAYLKSKLWWFGLLLIATGEGGNFLSYGFAPASVVAPLGTVALIANCLFAPLILRERFHLKELVGMGLAILGAVTVVFSSSQSNPRLDPDQLVVAISQIPFIIYTALTFASLVGLMVLSESSYGERLIGIDVGICALFGGYTVLSTKALSSLLSTILLNLFKKPIGWILVLVLVGTSVMQVKYLNRALMRFESKEVIPTQFVFFSLSAIIGSAVLYQEFRDVTLPQFINFAFGIATTFLGVHLLTSYSRSSEEQEDDHREEDDEDDEEDNETTPRQTTPAILTTVNENEQTPLLVPLSSSIGRDRNQLLRRISGTPLPPQVRVIRKSSNNDLTSTLGINTQAGFLLMATTPPGGLGSSFGSGSRMRAGSRGPRAGAGAGAGRDEERGQLGRGTSYASTRRGS